MVSVNVFENSVDTIIKKYSLSYVEFYILFNEMINFVINTFYTIMHNRDLTGS